MFMILALGNTNAVFADRHLNCDGAIQVTGSHNPPDYNGFKMVRDHQSYFGRYSESG